MPADSTVSVIIPTYDRADLLRESLVSVFAQTHPPAQVIVVDDGSTDHTDAVLREFGDRVCAVQNGHRGISSARNAGIDRSSGAFIAFLDSDDLWQPDKLALHLAFARAHPEADLTYTDAEEFNSAGTLNPSYVGLSPELRDPAHLFPAMVKRFAFPLTSATMVRTAALNQRGLRFMEDVHVGEDLGLFLEIMLSGGRFAYLAEPLTRRRMHDSNVSQDHAYRFDQRRVLYSRLLEKYAGKCTPEQREVLEWGLRDAHFRLGECAWAGFEMQQARRHFRKAWGADGPGVLAMAYSVLSWLPRGAIGAARSVKRALTGGS